MKFKKKYLFIELRNNWIVFGNNGNDIIEKYENIFRDIYLYRNCKYYLVLKIIKGKNYDCLVVMMWKCIVERKRFK